MHTEVLLNTIGLTAAAAILPGAVELNLFNLAGLLPKRAPAKVSTFVGKIAVLIPAHNEEASIGRCLESLSRCDNPNIADIYVIADNCTDRTASFAADLGACVMVRRDPERRGKGQALEFALSRLMRCGYHAFVIVDADSRVEENFLLEARSAFASGAEAFQCPYLVSNRDESRSTRLMDLALRGFNLVRPQSRARLGLSAGILGNGWGVTAETLRRVPYRAGSVVEDLEYHLELLEHGVHVRYLGSTAVYGAMPTGGKGRATQRARWEGGRLRMLRENGGKLAKAVFSGDWRMAEVLLDLLLPPLGYYVLLAVLCCVIPHSFCRILGAVGLISVAWHVITCVLCGNSIQQDLKTLASVPVYIGWKLLQIPLIVTTSFKRAAWIRTTRPLEAE